MRAGTAALEPSNVGDLLNAETITLSAHESLTEGIRKMHERPSRYAMVHDDDERFVGVLSWNSLVRLVAQGSYGSVMNTMAVADAMDKETQKIEATTPIPEILERLKHANHRCLVVIEGSKAVGILSDQDLVRESYPLLTRKMG